MLDFDAVERCYGFACFLMSVSLKLFSFQFEEIFNSCFYSVQINKVFWNLKAQ